MNKITPDDIRRKALKERGITAFKPKHGSRKLRPAPYPSINENIKTPMMRYLELAYGEPIEQMLLSGSLSVVAKKLNGEVDTSTISKWIKRLRLRYTTTNLPKCKGCTRYTPACESGVCHILMELELYDLVHIKRREILCED